MSLPTAWSRLGRTGLRYVAEHVKGKSGRNELVGILVGQTNIAGRRVPKAKVNRIGSGSSGRRSGGSGGRRRRGSGNSARRRRGRRGGGTGGRRLGLSSQPSRIGNRGRRRELSQLRGGLCRGGLIATHRRRVVSPYDLVLVFGLGDSRKVDPQHVGGQQVRQPCPVGSDLCDRSHRRTDGIECRCGSQRRRGCLPTLLRGGAQPSEVWLDCLGHRQRGRTLPDASQRRHRHGTARGRFFQIAAELLPSNGSLDQ